MVKKFTLMFLLGIFGLFTTNLIAQEDATIDPANIRYWIGEGQNEMVFIVNWNEPDTALAWGYRFNENEITLKDVMDGIVAEDYRFGYAGTSYVSDITFYDGILDLRLSGMYWMSIKNGDMCQNYFDAEPIHNGDYVKWGDESCGILLDPNNYVYVWTKEVAAVYPLANEAMIDPSEILYWIGEGENWVIFTVNWNEPNVALAWGYRFSEPSVTVEQVMDAIAAADGRFSYIGSEGWLSDIMYNDYVNQYALVGPYWMYNINGNGAMLGYNEQTVGNCDYIKWGDVSCGTEIAPWTYVWEQPIEPVTVYNNLNEVAASSMSIYPNPATDRLFVEAENLKSVEIYDMTGRNVLTTSLSDIDLRDLEAGIYFVTVRSENAAKTTKLVVK